MSKIQEIEKALEDAKKEEQLKYRLLELEQLTKNFLGKCFGTHTFDRNHAAAHMSAVYYERFYIEGNEIYVIEHKISLAHMDAHYKKSMKHIKYDRNIHNRVLSGNEYNAQYNLQPGYSNFRKEISFIKFKELWECGEEANIIIKNAFRGKFPELEMEWLSQGDHDTEREIDNCISEMGIEIIDFKNYPIVHRVIEFRRLPLFDRSRYLPKLYTSPILKWLIKKLKKDAASPFTSYRKRDSLLEDIQILQNFINNYL